ncbi:bile acid:sodium symporter family protein [bacterium]|nr:bile acid:sodium symporter family protein [bacterium]
MRHGWRGAISLVNRLFPLWVILGCGLAFFRPQVFQGFMSERVTLFFGLTMFGIGVTLELGQAVVTLKRFDKVVLGTLAQFTIMPFTAWALTRVVPINQALALGLIITGCVPGAMSSNVLSYVARGDVSYSVALTTLSTFISPWVTPALTLLLLGDRIHIPYTGMMLTIIYSVILPLAGGMLFRRLLGRRLDRFIELFPALSVAAIVVICSVVVSSNVALIREASLNVFLLVLALNAIGLGGGYLFGRAIRLNPAGRRTLAIEIGMQNAGMGVILALTHFKNMSGVALPSAIFTVWCIITASLFTLGAPGQRQTAQAAPPGPESRS